MLGNDDVRVMRFYLWFTSYDFFMQASITQASITRHFCDGTGVFSSARARFAF